MPHLTLEAIARLVDEQAAASEAAHLETCAHCRQELEDMRADAAVLAALPPIDPPAGEWAVIESRLAAEGLVRHRLAFPDWRTGLLRMAAAIAVFLMGTAAGAAWLGGGDAGTPAAVTANDDRAVAPRMAPGESLERQATPRTADSGAQLVASEPSPAAPRIELPAGLRSNPQLAAFLAGEPPRDYAEAVSFYREAEGLYLGALTRMAELGGGNDYGDPYARLAALEAITSITRAALGQAPADPVLNGYHVTALAQRDATLRQIAARSTDSWF
jgi:hypothetical protein